MAKVSPQKPIPEFFRHPWFRAFMVAADAAQIVQRAKDFGQPLQIAVERRGAILGQQHRKPRQDVTPPYWTRQQYMGQVYLLSHHLGAESYTH